MEPSTQQIEETPLSVAQIETAVTVIAQKLQESAGCLNQLEKKLTVKRGRHEKLLQDLGGALEKKEELEVAEKRLEMKERVESERKERERVLKERATLLKHKKEMDDEFEAKMPKLDAELSVLPGRQENLNEVPMSDRLKLLKAAVERDNLPLLKDLVDSGMKLSTRVDKGETLLHLAIRNLAQDIIRYLLEHEADLQIGNPTWVWEKLLALACEFGSVDVIKHLRNKDMDVLNNGKSLHDASWYGRINVIKYLLDNGADHTLVNEQGYTALGGAARADHLDAVKYLLSRGAELNVVNHYQFTPIHSACEAGNLQALIFMHQNGADLAKSNEIRRLFVNTGTQRNEMENYLKNNLNVSA